MKSRSFIIATSFCIYSLATTSVKSEKPVASISERKVQIVTAAQDNTTTSHILISTVPFIKKYSCDRSACKLDLALIDIKAEMIAVEVGLLGTHLKTFKSKGSTSMVGHWYGESGFSYLNLLKKGTGPIGNALWFGILYDGENDIYYDISPDASAT